MDTVKTSPSRLSLMTPIVIITPTWNSGDEFLQLSRSLIKNTTVPASLIVVDNGSLPEELYKINGAMWEMISKGKIQPVEVINNETNLGIPVAQNQGLDRAAYHLGHVVHWVVFLDADTEVNPGWLWHMIEFANKNPYAGVVGAAYSPEGPSTPVFHHDTGSWYKHELMDGMIEGETVDFAGVLLRHDIVARGIRMDEGYKIYDGHDQDFCWRVRSWGYDILQMPTGQIIHRPSTAMKKCGYQWAGGGPDEWSAQRAANVLRFVKTWRPFVGSRRHTIADERTHLAEMNEKLLEEAGSLKDVPLRGGTT